jgi:hypothetical protein
MTRNQKEIDELSLENIDDSFNFFKSKSGVNIYKAFLSDRTLSDINLELDELFQKSIFNHRHIGSIWHTNFYKQLSHPTKLNSINLLEIAIDIFNEAVPLSLKESYILTNVEIFSETNTDILHWHTDGRRGMIRAQIYLRGGDSTAGGFLYASGTHMTNHKVSHKLTKLQLDHLSDRILNCSGEPGDLVTFDPFGFHSRLPCNNERRTIMFEFQDSGSAYSKCSIPLVNTKITKKVLKNINIFLPKENADLSTYKNHGLDAYRDIKYIPFSFLSKLYYLFFRNLLKQISIKLARVNIKTSEYLNKYLDRA